MTPDEFNALFDAPARTVFRLEALPVYAVGGTEEDRYQAFLAGRPLPERSVRTNAWVARIALSTLTEGRAWTRVRVVDEPLSDYQRYQLESYRESQAAGEQVLLLARAQAEDVGEDFWLLDGGTDQARAVVMRYDDAGHWLAANLVEDPASLAKLDSERKWLESAAVPLNEFLAGAGRGC